MTEAEWLAATDPHPMLDFLRGKASDRKLRLFVIACCRRIEAHLPGPMRAFVDVAERYADGEASDEKVRAARVLAFPDLDPLFAEVDRVREELAARFPRHLVERVVELALGGGEYPSPGHRFDWVTELAAARSTACPDEALREVIIHSELAATSLSDTVDYVGRASGEGDPWEAAGMGLFAGAEAAAMLGPYNTYHDRQTAEWASQAALLRCIFGNPFRPISFDPRWRSEAAISLATALYTERAFDRLPILADALEEAGCDQPDILNHCRGRGPHARGCWVVDLVLGKE